MGNGARDLYVLSPFSRFWLFMTLWTVAHKAPLSMGFSRQEHWNGLPFPFPMHLLTKISHGPTLHPDFLIVCPSFWLRLATDMCSHPLCTAASPSHLPSAGQWIVALVVCLLWISCHWPSSFVVEIWVVRVQWLHSVTECEPCLVNFSLSSEANSEE